MFGMLCMTHQYKCRCVCLSSCPAWHKLTFSFLPKRHPRKLHFFRSHNIFENFLCNMIFWVTIFEKLQIHFSTQTAEFFLLHTKSSSRKRRRKLLVNLASLIVSTQPSTCQPRQGQLLPSSPPPSSKHVY